MNERDDDVRSALERLRVPPEPASFFDELWEQAQARERAAARRWRRVSLVLALVAAGAISSAGVLAASPAASNVVDLTAQCRAELRGGLPVFIVNASPSAPAPAGGVGKANPPPGFTIDSSLSIETGEQHDLLEFSNQFSGYQLDRRACVTARARVELKARGLPSAGVYSYPGYTSLRRRCIGFGRFVFRIRITNDSEGTPQRAELAIVTVKGKPLVFVQWASQRVVTFAAPACRDASP